MHADCSIRDARTEEPTPTAPAPGADGHPDGVAPDYEPDSGDGFASADGFDADGATAGRSSAVPGRVD